MKQLFFLLIFLNFTSNIIFAQVFSFDVKVENSEVNHRILIDNNYFVETVFNSSDAQFIYTRGGFYTKTKKNYFHVIFEFNSNYKKDSLKEMIYSEINKMKKISNLDQNLEGKWLMAGRVGPSGEEKRRDTKRSRKTLKFLIDGHFQWTAYNTETFQFFGCGGGKYSAVQGDYNESIEYFSRDKTRAGKTLSFKYEEKGNDWYHSGFSSKGKPLHEIWTLRKTE